MARASKARATVALCGYAVTFVINRKAVMASKKSAPSKPKAKEKGPTRSTAVNKAQEKKTSKPKKSSPKKTSRGK